jgi:nicotinamide-nucleotide amidase
MGWAERGVPIDEGGDGYGYGRGHHSLTTHDSQLTTAVIMRAAILSIGDEIVHGLTTDTNSGFVAGRLREEGVRVVGGFSVTDDVDRIVEALERALTDAELVVTTGGLGPTADDLTTVAVARLAGRPLELDAGSLAAIEERFRAIGREMSPNNRKQAEFPAGSTVLANPIGTAPGFVCAVERGGRTCHVASMPGVPREMRRMADEQLMPWVRARGGGARFASRTFSVVGLAESKLDELLAGAYPADVRVAFRAAFPKMQVRLSVEGGEPDALAARLDALEATTRERLGAHLYAVGDADLAETLGALLCERELTLAVAESCTGGLIGDRITDVAGSSRYFVLGTVVYADDAKRSALGVPAATLEAHGAVSTETAEAMARGVRERAGASLGLATTGIAGPEGGSAEKPVGTVCVAIAWRDGVWSQRYDLGARERRWIKQMTAQTALDLVRRWLLENPTTPGRGG